MCPGVPLCVYPSVGLCVAVPASDIGCSRLQSSYYCIPSRRSTTHPSVYYRYYCVAYGGSYIPCDPVYPPEVGYLGSLAMLHPVVSGTELLACATWRSAEWVYCRYCGAADEVEWQGYEVSRQPWDPMDPP